MYLDLHWKEQNKTAEAKVSKMSRAITKGYQDNFRDKAGYGGAQGKNRN